VLQAALIAGIVSVSVAVIANGLSFWIFRHQTGTERNAVRTARLLLNQREHAVRTFELLKRRIGGFNDDELRKILVRAGAIRMYGSYRSVYVAQGISLTPDQEAWVDQQEPVELWGLASRAPNSAYLTGHTLMEPEFMYKARGFRVLGINGTENRVKVTRVLQIPRAGIRPHPPRRWSGCEGVEADPSPLTLELRRHNAPVD
jgi:hypothetical protein